LHAALHGALLAADPALGLACACGGPRGAPVRRWCAPCVGRRESEGRGLREGGRDGLQHQGGARRG